MLLTIPRGTTPRGTPQGILRDITVRKTNARAPARGLFIRGGFTFPGGVRTEASANSAATSLRMLSSHSRALASIRSQSSSSNHGGRLLRVDGPNTFSSSNAHGVSGGQGMPRLSARFPPERNVWICYHLPHYQLKDEIYRSRCEKAEDIIGT